VGVGDGSVEINYRCTGALPEPQSETASAKPRVVAPAASQVDLDALSENNTRFALDLFRALRDAKGNLFFSPYSISAALAVTYAGARGETADEMASTLHFTLPQEHLHPAFNELDLQLAERGEGALGKDEQGFRLRIVNAIWGQTGYAFLDQFLDTLAENYGAGLRLLDFSRTPEQARVTINDWISEQTEAQIPELIPQGLIDELTRLVLTNAIYFNAAWQAPFPEELTDEATFHLLDGTEQSVPLMHQAESLGYMRGDQFVVVELPYDGMELAMLVLLPDAGAFEIVQAQVDIELLRAIWSDIRYRQVSLAMPRFEFDADLSLAETLADLGMPTAFGAQADFSGMTGQRDLFISDVIHKAFVSVDEAGTEAAAATAVIMKRLGLSEPPVEVVIDRPFILMIRDLQTNTLLFMGRVMSVQQ
jgi:serpin B